MFTGLMNYKAETLESVSENGMVTMEGTTVRGHTIVRGTLTLSNANLHSLEMQGTVTSTSTRFGGDVNIQGMMKAISSFFEGTLSISTQELHLSNCKTKDIKVLRNSHNPGLQKVVLDNDSIVEGNIYFQATEGEVEIKEGSRVTGSIFRGTLNEL